MKTFWRAWILLCLALTAATVAAPVQSVPSAQAEAGCTELIADGGFETGSGGAGWQLGVSPLTPETITYAKHSGDRSLVLGITRGGNKQGFSSAKQMVTLPSAATKVTLTFWAYTLVEGVGNGDSMQLVLLHPDGSVLYKLWDSTNDSRLWNQQNFDLTRWRGQTVQVYFNVYNNGTGGTVGMFLDDVSLSACPGAAPSVTPTRTSALTPTVATPWPTLPSTRTATPSRTPTATTTATATPLPSNCLDLVQNGGFEAGLSPWEAGPGYALPVQRVGSPVHGDAWALRLGTQVANLRSHSPVRQVITLPSASQATLSFYVYTWSESLTGDDLQEALVFSADATLLQAPLQSLGDERSWRRVQADLSPYSGQTIQLLFNVYNDGENGRAAMFLDDVSLVACAPDSASLAAARATIGTGMQWPDLDQARPGAPAGGRAPAQASAGTPYAAASFTPPMTRIALGTPPPAPAVPPPAVTAVPPVSATPQAGLWERLSSGVMGQWPAGWPVAVAAIVLLVILGGWALSRRGP